MSGLHVSTALSSRHQLSAPPSPWLLRWAQAWQQAGATALDLACGSGRHARLLHQAGLKVTALDRDRQALQQLQQVCPDAEIIEADIEQGPWPFETRQFDLVLVTNYLWRPLLPAIVGSVAPGGWLIYETFAHGQQTIGRPARPDFLLQPGELLQACAGLRIVGYEDGFEALCAQGTKAPTEVNGRYVQRVAAHRSKPLDEPFAKYWLVTAPRAPCQALESPALQ
ncbi:class I SAM-dependent methyltransferase [Roseateles sp. BYS180W]|uniref:Class I SAM-dependent methyltransferase n=1 Tax=Roseateles rivi TaxID=3299028 RepID=A0ABW7FSW4_9BURK